MTMPTHCCCRTLVHSFDQDPDLVLAYAQSAVIDEAGTTTGTMAD